MGGRGSKDVRKGIRIERKPLKTAKKCRKNIAVALCLQRGHFCAVAGLDPNRDPNTEKSRWIQADTVDRPPSRKHAKAPESVVAQRFPALIVSSHAGGHWFESSSLHQNLTSSEVRFFLFSAKGKTSCLSRKKTKRGNGKTVPSFFIR